jgi:hypothetical protein
MRVLGNIKSPPVVAAESNENMGAEACRPFAPPEDPPNMLPVASVAPPKNPPIFVPAPPSTVLDSAGLPAANHDRTQSVSQLFGQSVGRSVGQSGKASGRP